jgi:hypothetical protein
VISVHGGPCGTTFELWRVVETGQTAQTLSDRWFKSSRVGLRGRLSNPPEPLSGLLTHSLTRESRHKTRSRKVKEQAGWPDGRRKFGSVSGAILAVLAQTDSEMKVKAIHEQVERVLGGRVSRLSVSDYLLTRSKGPRPLFERARHGHYRLLR